VAGCGSVVTKRGRRTSLSGGTWFLSSVECCLLAYLKKGSVGGSRSAPGSQRRVVGGSRGLETQIVMVWVAGWN